MAEHPQVGDLEIDQDLDYETRAYNVRRVAWWLMALIVLAALAGLFGSGPLSHTRAGEAGGPLSLEYGRFARLTAPATLEIQLGPQAAAVREARVWIDRRYLQDMQIEDMVPEPERVEAGADRLVLVFPLAASAGAPGTTSFELHLQAQRVGPLHGRVGLEGGPSLDFHQFVYP